MAEHVHEWTVDHQILPETLEGTDVHYGECFAYCECGEELRCHEIEAHINEYETLDVEKIKWATAQRILDILLAYADTLEGK